MAEFDHGVKMIAATTGRQLARLAGVMCRHWQAAESTVQASLEKLADRVFLARQGRQRFVVYFEFYTTWDRDAPWDMLAKSGLLSQREQLPTVCIAVVLRQRGFRSRGGQLRLETAGGPTQQLWFKEVCLWQMKPESWWEDEPGLMALYPLCQHGQQPRKAIRHAASVIESKGAAPGEQGTFLTLLGIFGRLNYPRLDVLQIIGVEQMKESTFYQEIMQEGELVASRADILQVLRVRFRSEPPAEIATALDTLKKLKQLKPLLDLAATCTSIQVFQDALRTRGVSP